MKTIVTPGYFASPSKSTSRLPHTYVFLFPQSMSLREKHNPRVKHVIATLLSSWDYPLQIIDELGLHTSRGISSFWRWMIFSLRSPRRPFMIKFQPWIWCCPWKDFLLWCTQFNRKVRCIFIHLKLSEVTEDAVVPTLFFIHPDFCYCHFISLFFIYTPTTSTSTGWISPPFVASFPLVTSLFLSFLIPLKPSFRPLWSFGHSLWVWARWSAKLLLG